MEETVFFFILNKALKGNPEACDSPRRWNEQDASKESNEKKNQQAVSSGKRENTGKPKRPWLIFTFPRP